MSSPRIWIGKLKVNTITGESNNLVAIFIGKGYALFFLGGGYFILRNKYRAVNN